ncbi:MAG: hypothetical protein PHU81_04410 [Acidobacteriota bacterium]|nr:hypothetical protein [Acidobacteriota bacterium]
MKQVTASDKKRNLEKRGFSLFFSGCLILCLIGSLVQPALAGIEADHVSNRVIAGGQQKKAEVKKELRAASPASPNEVGSELLIENKFLEKELSLAKNQKYYFVINLKDKKIELRVRGMLLKSWIASQIRCSGQPWALSVISLNQKSALNPPERKMIRPGEGDTAGLVEQDPNIDDKANGNKSKKENTSPDSQLGGSSESFQLEALEITDMPGNYELIFDNGLQVSVRAGAGKGPKLSRLKENLSWYIFLPVKNFLMKNKTIKPRMILYFDLIRDAQGIYWAFIDGIQGIIWLP